MIARGLKDRAQTSLRVALGASRGRLIRKVLVESTLLAMTGAGLGIGVAYAGTRLILSLAFQIGGPNNYVPIEATPSWPVLLFTLGVSLLTGVLFGIAPAWMTSHTDPAGHCGAPAVRSAPAAPDLSYSACSCGIQSC